jgi:hypothetical protein
MRPRLVKMAISVLILAVIPISAADFWEEKDYTTWSEKECMKLLRKSPWAFYESFRTTANLGSTETGVRETTEIIEFRLLTAKPIRMAFGRLQLLQKPNDEALKEQISRYVEAPSGDEILVQVSCRTIPAAGFWSNLHAFFARAVLSTFVDTTHLISADGEHVPMIGYLPWTEERPNAVFVFPRLAENEEPYFTGNEKSIALRSEFDMDDPAGPRAATIGGGSLRSAEALIGARKNYKIYVKMKPKDMMFQGELAL